jgi:pimeloyl-ACP methyl ester carboxylesterase
VRRGTGITVAAIALAWLPTLTGCTLITYLGTDPTGQERGMTYYLGGAGTFGHVGTIDVPHGLREAGYDGGLEVFGWQSILGGTLRDQLDRQRNLGQARRLAQRIQNYLDRFPGRPVNIIALSAGTGISTWAIESLPEGVRVRNVVFLGSSLSRDYELSTALARVDGALYNFYSPRDSVLRYGVPVAGSVDREFDGPAVGGLYGFRLPPLNKPDAREIYRLKLRNMPYRAAYARYGYKGGHTDSTTTAFVRSVIAPLIMKAPPAESPNGHEPPAPDGRERAPVPDESEPASQPGASTRKATVIP